MASYSIKLRVLDFRFLDFLKEIAFLRTAAGRKSSSSNHTDLLRNRSVHVNQTGLVPNRPVHDPFGTKSVS